MTDFELLQKEFKKWQQRFGLTGYKVFFECGAMERKEVLANITISQVDMTAAVKLNNNIRDEDKPEGKGNRSIKEIAKHEAIHLLTARLKFNDASNEDSARDERTQAEEELANRLEDLIPELGE